MAFKEIDPAEENKRFSSNVAQLKAAVFVLNETSASRPLTKSEQNFLDGANSLLKISDSVLASKSTLKSAAVSSLSGTIAEANNSRKFSGGITAAGASIAAVLSAPVLPFMNIEDRTKTVVMGGETHKSGEITTSFGPNVNVAATKDGFGKITMGVHTGVMNDMFTTIGDAVSDRQRTAWESATAQLQLSASAVLVLYKSFNEIAEAQLEGASPQKMAAAKKKLVRALEVTAQSFDGLAKLQKQHGQYLEQLNGQFEVAKTFLKDAAVAAVTTVASGYAISKAGHALEHFIPKVMERAVPALAEAGIGAERVAATATFAVRGVGAAEKVGHTYETIHNAEASAAKNYANAMEAAKGIKLSYLK